MNDDKQRPPSRRTFVALLGAAVAAVVIKPTLAPAEPDRPSSPYRPRWIGHI